MKNSLFTIAIAVLYVGAALAQRQTSIKPASVYRQDGITFVSPNQPGWVLLESDKMGTVLEKRDERSVSTVSAKTIKTRIYETDKKRLTNFENMKSEELSTLDRDSIHFNYLRFKGSMCLQYDGIFKLHETSASNFKYFNLKGYLCPHSKAKDSAVQIEFSTRSGTRGFTKDLDVLTDEFFEKLSFSKAE